MTEHRFNCLTWLLIFATLAYWWWTFAVIRLQNNVVEVSDVSLGTLQPGSKVEFSVTIYNNGFKEIALRPIKTSCGCVAPDREKPVVLAPGENVLKFAYSAPSSPEKIEQDIWFFAEKGTPSAWKVEIDGEVAADIWAIPARLTLLSGDSSSDPAGTFVLHTVDRNVKSVTASPDSLKYHLEQEDAGRYAFSVTSNSELSHEVQEKGKITGSLLIEFEEADQEPLEVPIDLVPRPKFTVLPARLELSRDALTEKTSLQKVAVKKLADLSFDCFHVETVVPWVNLVDKYESGNYIFLTFEFLPDEMPKYESVTYARLAFSDLPSHHQVECRVIVK